MKKRVSWLLLAFILFSLKGGAQESKEDPKQDTEQTQQEQMLDGDVCEGICCTEEGRDRAECREYDPEDLAIDYMLGRPDLPDY